MKIFSYLSDKKNKKKLVLNTDITKIGKTLTYDDLVNNQEMHDSLFYFLITVRVINENFDTKEFIEKLSKYQFQFNNEKDFPKFGQINFADKVIQLPNSKDAFNYLMIILSSYDENKQCYGFINKDDDNTNLMGRRFTNSYAKLLVKKYFNEKMSIDIEEEILIKYESIIGHKEMERLFFASDYEQFQKISLDTFKSLNKRDIDFVVKGIRSYEHDKIEENYTKRFHLLSRETPKEDLYQQPYLIKK